MPELNWELSDVEERLKIVEEPLKVFKFMVPLHPTFLLFEVLISRAVEGIWTPLPTKVDQAQVQKRGHLFPKSMEIESSISKSFQSLQTIT